MIAYYCFLKDKNQVFKFLGHPKYIMVLNIE